VEMVSPPLGGEAISVVGVAMGSFLDAFRSQFRS
jgi:hypothetical protein